MTKTLCGLFGLPYQIGVFVRNFLYRSGFIQIHSLSRPVISIGNLTFGGTGKTPMVLWVAEFLQRQGHQVGILSRGYKSGANGNDEGAMIADSLPSVQHIQDPDRVHAGKDLIQNHQVDTIILDDGFQHLRLNRDLNLLLIDATDPFGGGSCPPFGRLRESLSAISRADQVILSRANLVSENQRDSIWREIFRRTSQKHKIEVEFSPSRVRDTLSEKIYPLTHLEGQKVVLLSAVGNPKAFRMTVELAKMVVVQEFCFRDHHWYSAQELEKVFAAFSNIPVLTTHKDWVKIRSLPGFKPWILQIETRFLKGGNLLENSLLKIVTL